MSFLKHNECLRRRGGKTDLLSMRWIAQKAVTRKGSNQERTEQALAFRTRVKRF